MTSKEIYEKVRAHLLKQGERSIMNGKCAYRSAAKSCAIGCLMSSEEYNYKYERHNIHKLLNNFEKLNYLLPTDMSRHDGEDFLSRLQQIHDFEDVCHWDSCLQYFAAKNKLYEKSN